jgi:hypothetical protein
MDQENNSFDNLYSKLTVPRTASNKVFKDLQRESEKKDDELNVCYVKNQK